MKICPEHGEHPQCIVVHTSPGGCPICAEIQALVDAKRDLEAQLRDYKNSQGAEAEVVEELQNRLKALENQRMDEYNSYLMETSVQGETIEKLRARIKELEAVNERLRINNGILVRKHNSVCRLFARMTSFSC
jgi:hypothetical protein